MTTIFISFISFIVTFNMVIFDFNQGSDLTGWNVVDDVVMGGRSNGDFHISDEGHGVFRGNVSLENNGGFSSVRYGFKQMEVSGYDKIVIKLKGDGKRYQFRLKTDSSDRHSYIYHFETTVDWQTIEIPLSEMYPGFRGNKLSLPNYPGKVMEEIAFLIANNKAESFKLEIDLIGLQ